MCRDGCVVCEGGGLCLCVEVVCVEGECLHVYIYMCSRAFRCLQAPFLALKTGHAKCPPFYYAIG